MPELLILRHANAIRYDYHDDFNRRLRDKGKRNAQRVGTWLALNDKLPKVIYTSPANRALTTAEKVCKSAGQGTSRIIVQKNLYPGSRAAYEKLLNSVSDKRERVMLVGHNPELESLVAYLTRDKVPVNRKGNILSPASLAILQFDGKWKDLGKGQARLKKIMHAENLPERFPYPLAKANEWRIRPSYYYSQSAVIPFKYVDGKLNILLITSSKGKHWVVPKGIHEPGMSAQESAAKEAFEEAAVEGKVYEACIGSYRYQKWEADCNVKVYAMRVKKQLSNRHWEESHRKRCWVTVNKAVDMLDNKDLAKMVANLPGWMKKNCP